MTPLPSLATPRLVLLPVELEDLSALAAFHRTPGNHQPELRPPGDERVLSAAARWIASADAQKPFGMWKIIIGDQLIGRVGFISGGTYPELVYFIDIKHRGHGFAVEASRALIDWAFRTTAAQIVLACTRPTNYSSVSVMKKLGMQRNPVVSDEMNEAYFLEKSGQFLI